jgi:transcriptional regulator with XRE-family HTH domain
MTGGSAESPVVARRRVRLALRQARQATTPSLSQADVAGRLGWSLSKMQRIENGDVTVSGTDLRALLDLYGGFSADEIAMLIESSRISRRQRWWTRAEFREHLTPAVLKLMSFESAAAEIRVFQPRLVPGILQTPEMAESVLKYWLERLPAKYAVRREVRLLRRQAIIENADGPCYFLILDESVLLRGEDSGAEMMAAQMSALVETSELPRVRIRLLPLQGGGLYASIDAFTIVDLGEPAAPGGRSDDAAVVYREVWDTDSVLDDRVVVARYRTYFDELWQRSLDEQESRRRIADRAAFLRSKLDHSS